MEKEKQQCKYISDDSHKTERKREGIEREGEREREEVNEGEKKGADPSVGAAIDHSRQAGRQW